MLKENKNRKTFMMFLLAFLVAFFIVSLVEVLRSALAPSVADVQLASAVMPGDAMRAPLSFADLAEKLKPAVVNISTTKTVRPRGGMLFGSPFGEGSPFDRYFGGDDFFNKFFGEGQQREFKQKSLGSGFIISFDGYIFTNNHVVEQADKILVKLSNGEKEYEAKVIGRDAKTDIALIQIKPDKDKKLAVADIGDSDKLRVGDWVLAIGNPFGLSQTVTAGIVSAKGRVIGAGPYDNFIQTDASINPGNSGGPLFSMDGKVVGINTAIIAQGQGIGFAIPINTASTMLPQLKAKGSISRGWLGISIQDVTEDIAKAMKLKETTGALIADVFEGDPADKAGLKAGDVIVEINGKPVKNSHELLMLVAAFTVGEKVDVRVIREGQVKRFSVTIAERKEKDELAAGSGHFGMKVRDITPDIARRLGLPEQTGVIVVAVQEGSTADEAGIRPQDIILQINWVNITSSKDYEREILKASGREVVLLKIKRGRAEPLVVPLRP